MIYMQDFSTPMMQQYKEIKKRYQDCLLFYRMGDFYELFMEDAHIGAQILNITLTSKAGGKDGKIPMAGIPYHAVDTYLAKLVKAGYKVAICEQLSPPNKKGLVKRDVIRVVTPGTMMDEKALDQKSHNYIVSIALQNDRIGLSVADISTGFLGATEFEGNQKEYLLKEELTRLSPTECILPEHLYNNTDILQIIKQAGKDINIYCFQEWNMFAEDSKKFLENHFNLQTLTAFGIDGRYTVLESSAALIGYLQTTQLSKINHIQKIQFYTQESAMMLDKSTMINLELFSTIREHDIHGSLLYVLDETQTSMGGRLLKEWIKKPLIDKKKILERQDGLEEITNASLTEVLRTHLATIIDIERIISRLSVNIGSARDVISLKNALRNILTLKEPIKTTTSPLLKTINNNIPGSLEKIIDIIENTITDEPPTIELHEGNLIKENVHKELDKLRTIIHHSQTFIQKLEQKEKERTGIATLKIRYNQAFGFYIEISKANAHLAPKHYMRKQTLVNGERFITEELKKHEEIILTAQEKANDLEYQLFQKVLQKILTFTQDMQKAAYAIAQLDCLSTFAYISDKYQYVRPKLLYSGEIRIHEGRHPVVERLLEKNQRFVPNDIVLDNINQSLLLITGPNMAGKSVLIRQVATIILLNQIGCFVPAKSAHLSIVDRIFVRSGASDVITSGLSTFMVEMVETAHILHNATEKSLIIMDEIGRGTSTYDGISIAWAVAEYLVTHFSSAPKTLFATHYHELQALENKYPKQIKNYHMAVADDNGEPIFLHTLLPEGASHSFGVAVAKLAGIPKEVIEKATEMLHVLENRETSTNAIVPTIPEANKERTWEIRHEDNHQSFAYHFIQKELEQLNVANMTPLEALNKLAELKDQIKLLQDRQKEFLEAD